MYRSYVNYFISVYKWNYFFRGKISSGSHQSWSVLHYFVVSPEYQTTKLEWSLREKYTSIQLYHSVML